MSIISKVLEHNKNFVEQRKYEPLETTKFPNKKLVIVTCMDTRLVELLAQAMNIKNGDAKMIKTAGAIVSHPFDSIMRSILVAIYELQAEEVCVIGHHDCGMKNMNPTFFLEKVEQSGVPKETIKTLLTANIDLHDWLSGFHDVEENVINSVNVIKNHPFLPKHVRVHGMVIHPQTGKLDLVTNSLHEAVWERS